MQKNVLMHLGLLGDKPHLYTNNGFARLFPDDFAGHYCRSFSQDVAMVHLLVYGISPLEWMAMHWFMELHAGFLNALKVLDTVCFLSAAVYQCKYLVLASLLNTYPLISLPRADV